MGSIPIGAAISDQDGRVVARGRNRIFEQTAPEKLLCGHRLAHAEMNALLALAGREADPLTHVLYTTTEPCALCIGAIRMWGIGEVHYAASDSAAGSVALLEATPFMRRSGLRVIGPANLEFEALIVAFHVEFSLRTGHFKRAPWILESWQESVPKGVSLGQDLYRSGRLQCWRAEQRPIADVVHSLADPAGQAHSLGSGSAKS